MHGMPKRNDIRSGKCLPVKLQNHSKQPHKFYILVAYDRPDPSSGELEKTNHNHNDSGANNPEHDSGAIHHDNNDFGASQHDRNNSGANNHEY